MDPPVGRLTTMDPLAEKYYSISPYAYVNNNPMRFVDPDGQQIGFPPFGFPISGIPIPLPIIFPVMAAQEDLPTVSDVKDGIGSLFKNEINKLKSTISLITLPIVSHLVDATNDDNVKEVSNSKKAKDSSKNEKHGDDGRSLSKGEKHINDLKQKAQNAGSKKERKEIENKIQNIRQSGLRNKKGEEHGRTKKR